MSAASYMPRASMMFEGRVQVKAACATALCCTLDHPILSHRNAPQSADPSCPHLQGERDSYWLAKAARKFTDTSRAAR